MIQSKVAVQCQYELNGYQIKLQRINPNDEAKSYGDILSTKCGRTVVIDITFSSRTNLSLRQLEHMKTNEYLVNRAYDPDHFVPFVITSNGAWGARMHEYMGELCQISK
jgi:hypothetical protein